MASAGRSPPPHTPPRLDRIRRLAGGFAFVPNQFLHHGFFASLSHTERSLYFFLVLAGDRNGVSFYAYDRICDALELTPDEYLLVRNSLLDKDLIAFDTVPFRVHAVAEQSVAPKNLNAKNRIQDRPMGFEADHHPELVMGAKIVLRRAVAAS